MPLYALHRGGTEADAGTLTTLFTLAALFFRLPIGWVMDRWGRRPVLIGGALCGVASALLYPQAESVPAIFVSRPLHGIALGVFSTATAAVVPVEAPAGASEKMVTCTAISRGTRMRSMAASSSGCLS